MKLPTAAILATYLDAVQRIQRMIDRSGPDNNIGAWLKGMIAINNTYGDMKEVPYRLLDDKMCCLGIGRQIWRLFQAVQLLAEWRFASNTTVTHRDVLVAFNEVGEEDFGSDTIFTGGDVSPEAQRAILATLFFADGMRGWIIEGIGIEAPMKVTITAGVMGMTAEHLPPNVRFDPAKKIWDVIRD